jgi:hypothetical protein
MDSPAMIDEATFEDIVHRTVGSVLELYGYEPMKSDGFRARFEKPASYVEVMYDAARSHEVSIWLGEVPIDGEPPLELADVLRATDCGAEDVKFAELIQTADADALGRLLDRAAQLLRQCAGRFLADGRDAFGAARALRSERAAAYTAGLRNRQALDAADEAWESKDYGQVHDLLNPIRDALGESHRRRLEFAEKKLK